GLDVGIVGAGSGAKAVDISGRPESVKRAASFDGRLKRRDRRCDQFYASTNLRTGNRKQGLTDTVAVGSVCSYEVIVIEIDFSQQAIAPVADAHTIIHADTFQTEHRSSAFSPNAIPRIAVTIVIKRIDT